MRCVGGTVAVAAMTVAASGCAATGDSGGALTSSPAPVAQQVQTVRPSCPAAVPAGWQQAVAASAVDSGGISTVPLAVDRTGEVVAVRDNGDTRDVLLIGADKSVTDIYAVPDPDRNDVGFAAVDEGWVVLGVDRIPRGANGVLPTLTRIDVVDRNGGAVRTVAQSSDEDHESGGPTIDSAALFGGKVYWITRDTYAGDAGVIRSYDVRTGAVADVASGDMRAVRATAAGLVWDVAWGSDGPRSEVKIPDTVPAPVTAALGAGRDTTTLSTDGSAYAWITGVEQGGTGVAWWSPGFALVRVTGDVVDVATAVPPVWVVGPYIVLGKGRAGEPDTSAIVVDSRSGAVTALTSRLAGHADRVVAADGGTIAMDLWAGPGTVDSVVGLLRSGDLAPLRC